MICGLFLLLLMKMNYEKIIIELLRSANKDGMSVKDISRYIYNSQNSFFAPLSYTSVYNNVASWLLRISRKKDAVIKKSSSRGMYCIDYSSSVWKQMQLQFDPTDNDSVSPSSDIDTSLSLF